MQASTVIHFQQHCCTDDQLCGHMLGRLALATGVRQATSLPGCLLLLVVTASVNDHVFRAARSYTLY